jgi:hypothetical protein
MNIYPLFHEFTVLPGNDCLDIHYTSVADSVWDTDSKEWPEWVAVEPYIKPQSNPLLLAADGGGSPLELHEHACICVAGSALHKFRNEAGGVVEYNWTVGGHNVENGYGYKPALGFRREFSSVFTMCCVGSKENRDWSKKHTFQILTDSAALPKGASFAHVAIGAITVDDVRYEARGTAFSVSPGALVTVDPGSSVIVCVSEN